MCILSCSFFRQIDRWAIGLVSASGGIAFILAWLARKFMDQTNSINRSLDDYFDRLDLIWIPRALQPLAHKWAIDFTSASLLHTSRFVVSFSNSRQKEKSSPVNAFVDLHRRLVDSLKRLCPYVTGKNGTTVFAPDTSRALEIAICSLRCSNTKIILSPFEHSAETAVVAWLRKVARIEVLSIPLTNQLLRMSSHEKANDFIESFRKIAEENAQKKTPKQFIIVISQVFFMTGEKLPTSYICGKLREIAPNAQIVIDAAHMLFERFDERTREEELLFDAMVISGHKWLYSPEPMGVVLFKNVPSITPYDALSSNGCISTVSTTALYTFEAALAMSDRYRLSVMQSRSSSIKKYVIDCLSQDFEILTESSESKVPSFILCIRPKSTLVGWREDGDRLRDFFYKRRIIVDVFEVEGDWWVRLLLPFYLERSSIDFAVKALQYGIRQ